MKEFITISIIIGVLNIAIYNMYNEKLLFISNTIYRKITIATWVKKFLFSFVPILNIYYLTEQVVLAWNYANKEKEFDRLLSYMEDKKIKDRMNRNDNKEPSILVMNCVWNHAIYVEGKLEHRLILNKKRNADIIKMILESDYKNKDFC